MFIWLEDFLWFAQSNGPHAKSAAMAEAIAHAVIDEITQNAQVTVDAGSSAGSYQIE
ncbi:hypothetical protein [Vibrio azureus]|uniref:Uncharacterized protein n=1 Tax=Vibrio azureus NBRC 104587 TaxID=1219077 RepID=U3ADI0_9VIBR|nr:hypothetical protein [Vibrio azureus]GAD77986.1 hypothetical protein VAZ01S_106_00010 [Vibrio azureus NBRC 104587]